MLLKRYFTFHNSLENKFDYFQKIRSQSHKDNMCLEAVKPQNKLLNRYRDVNPYDHSRIVLKRGSTDYINANLIKVEKANRQYILTQGPLSNTYSHFWLMIWEQECKGVSNFAIIRKYCLKNMNNVFIFHSSPTSKQPC